MGGGTSSNFASVSEYSNFFSQVQQQCNYSEGDQQDIIVPITLDNCNNFSLLLKNQDQLVYKCDLTSALNAQQSNMVSMNQAAKAGWFGNANNTSITDTVNNVDSFVNQNCNSSGAQRQLISTSINCLNSNNVNIKEFNQASSSTNCALFSDTSVVQSNSASITQKASGVDPSSLLMTLVWILLAVILVAIGVPILVSALGKSAKSITTDIGSSVSNVAKNAGSAASNILGTGSK
jgi:hypothetical protein